MLSTFVDQLPSNPCHCHGPLHPRSVFLTCSGIPLGFPFGTGGASDWVAVGTGVACKGLKELARV